MGEVDTSNRRDTLDSTTPRPHRQILDELLATGGIALQRGPLFEIEPDPKPDTFDFARIEGMMLGLAIGDALGNTTESQLPAQRLARYGEIRNYLPNRYAENRRVGLPSDDTQLAFWTLEQWLADGRMDLDHIAKCFCTRKIFGIGSSVRTFIHNYEAGQPWYQSGPASAGNGALMRIAPVVIPHLRTGAADLWVDAALLAMLTHNDPASISACLAFTCMLWRLVEMDAAPEPRWWLETFVEVARGLEGETRYQSHAGGLAYEGPLWQFVAQYVSAAYQNKLAVLDACNSWHSGAYLLETAPSVLYILMCYGDSPEQAIVRAVNDTWDNDTIAAIVGAAVGALHGVKSLPQHWRADLLGRTSENDDGQVQALLQAARLRCWP